jgi:hypothetical protein
VKEEMFFSEEKNQKTFDSARVEGYGIWPDGGEMLMVVMVG